MIRRAAIFLALATTGLVVLVALAGGLSGPRAERPEPQVEGPEEAVSPSALSIGDLAPGVSLQPGRRIGWTWLWDPLDWVDPITGTKVRLASLRKWWFHAEAFEPVQGQESAAGRFRFVRVRTYRLPKTLEEAQAVARGETAAIEGLVKLRVTADEARAETLSRRFRLGEEQAPAARTGPIRLIGKVLIEDVEQGLTIEGSDVTIEPERQGATGEGPFAVRHAAYRLEGLGLSLQHEENGESAVHRDRVELLRDVRLFLSGRMEGGHDLALDLASAEECPCEVHGPGGATIVRETTRTTERLHLTMRTRMRAEQEGGRSIEADRIDLTAWRPTPAPGDEKGAERGWALERFEADGNVVANYQGRTARGDPLLMAVVTRRLVHEGMGDRAAITVLEGDPDIRVIGRIPLEGIDDGDGTLRLSCRDQAWIGPAPATDVPPGGADGAYRRVILRGAARVERQEEGATPHRDLLEGDEITLLLVTRPAPGPSAAGRTETLAVSFAAQGNVRVGGTRMSGAADRLVATGLDGDDPVLVADGRTTTFTFSDLDRAGGPLGMNRSSREPRGAAPSGEPEPAVSWVVDRFLASGGVDATSAFAGPAVGLPAHLQGDSVSYDRISDLARLSGGPASPARIEVLGPDGALRDVVEAGHIEVERARGQIRAGGGVFGRLRPDDLAGVGGGLSQLPRSAPRTVGISTEGAIEVRMRRRGGEAEEGAEQVLRITGPFRVDLTGANGAVDRLRADRLELVLSRRSRADAAMLAPVTARAAPRTAPGTGRRPAPTARPRSDRPWEIRASDLTVTLAGSDVGAFEASGSVVVEGADGVVRGDLLVYDATSRRLGVRMRGGERAEAVFGGAEARNRVLAPEIVVVLGEGGPTSIRARGPVHALLTRTAAGSGGRGERFDVRCRDDVEVLEDRITTAGWSEVHGSTREPGATAWTQPWTLWTEQLVVEGRSLLARTAPDVLRLVAAGPRTTFLAGTGAERSAVWGDRFEIDLTSKRLTVSGTLDRPVLFRRGPEGAPTVSAEGTKVVVDMATGQLLYWDNPSIVLPAGDR